MGCVYKYKDKTYTKEEFYKYVENNLVEKSQIASLDSSIVNKKITGSDEITAQKYAFQLSNDLQRKLNELEPEQSESLTDILGEETDLKNSKLFQDVEKKTMDFLQTIGVEVQNVSEILDSNGNPIDAVSKADVLSKVIEVIENKRDITTLPEEAAHMFVALIRGTELYNNMMDKITRFEIFNSVNAEYGNVYNNDERKIKEEAVAKLISAHIVNQVHNQEKSELNRDLSTKWWNRVWNFIKNLLSPLKSSEISSYVKAAKMILERDIDGFKDLNRVLELNKNGVEDLVYYELSDTEETNLITLLEILTNSEIEYDFAENAYFRRGQNGERIRIKNRVSDLIVKYFKSNGAPNLSAAKGTYIHKLAQMIMEDLVAGEKIEVTTETIEDYIDRAKTQLLQENELIRNIYNDPNEPNAHKFFNLQKVQFQVMLNGLKYIHNQILENTERINALIGKPGAKPQIFSELPVYDELQDLAGTIDLLVVYPNGAVGIYDFKSSSFRTEMEGKQKYVAPFSEKRVQDFHQQISAYKTILAKSYGVKHFAETRIIPINMQFKYPTKANPEASKVDGFSFLEMGTGQDSPNHLTQIPVADENVGTYLGEKDTPELERVHDSQLAHIVDNLLLRRQQLAIQKKKSKFNAKLQLEYKRLDQIIKDIQLNRKIDLVIQESYRMYKLLKQLETETSNSPNYDYGVFREFLNFTDVLDRFYESVLVNKTGVTPENKEALSALPSILNAIKTISISKITEKLNEEESISITTPIYETGYITGIFKQLKDYDGEVYKRLARLVERNEEYIREHLNVLKEKITAIDRELGTWAQQKGMTKFDAFRKIYNFKKRGLVAVYSDEFFEAAATARAKKDLKWIKLHYKFDKTKFEANKEAYQRYIESLYGENPLEVKVLMEDWLRKYDVYDPKYSEQAYFNKKNHYLTINENMPDAKTWYSAEWKYLNESGNEVLKKYYETYVAYNKEFNEIASRPIRKGFVAEIRQDTIDRMSQLGLLKSISGLRMNFLHALETREYDVSNRELDPVTNEPMPDIPLLYLDPVTDSASSKEVRDIEEQLKNEGFLYGSVLYERELKKRVNKLELSKGHEYKSIDLTRSLLLFGDTVYTNKIYNDTVDEVKAIQYLMKSGTIHTRLTDPFGNPLFKDKITKEIQKRESIADTDLEIFDTFVNMYWYGLEMSKDIGIKGKAVRDEHGNIIREGKRYSGQKLYHLISTITTLKALPLNVVSAVGNAIGLNTNLKIIAAEGIFFNQQQVNTAHEKIARSDKTVAALLDYFEPSSRDLAREKANKLSAGFLSKYMTVDNLLYLYKKPDDLLDATVLISMLQNFGVDKKGNIRSLDKLDIGSKSLMDSVEIVGEKIQIKGITDNKENFIRFRGFVKEIATTIKGTSSNENKNQLGKNIFIKAFSKFRTWIPGLYKARMKKTHVMTDFDILDTGRYRTVATELFSSESVSQTFKEFGKLFLETLLQLPIVSRTNRQLLSGKTMYTGKKGGFNEKAVNIHFRDFLLAHPEYIGKFSKEDFIALRNAKLKGMAKELSFILSLSLMAAITKSLIPDEDEEFLRKFLSKNSYKFMNRGFLELTFWLSPSSALDILSTPSADIKTVLDVGDWIRNTFDVTTDTMQEIMGLEPSWFNVLIGGEPGETGYRAGWWVDGQFNMKKTSKDKTPPLYETGSLIPLINNMISFLDLWDQPVR